jgi:Crp-like helix-turn-helix domain
VRGSVARTLLELAEYVGKDVGEGRILLGQRFSRSDLAAMAGVARENVSGVLSDLKKRGLVTRCWNSYTLNDIGAPEREAHHWPWIRRLHRRPLISVWPSRENALPVMAVDPPTIINQRR